MPILNRTRANQPKARIITNGISDGARALKEKLQELGIDCSKVNAGSGPKTPRRFNLKWGCFPLTPTQYGGLMANATAGDTSLNKLLCFQALAAAGVPVPQFTAEREVAARWLAEGCRRIYERHSLRGSEGEGIRIVGEGGEPTLNQAPLYTKGMFGRRREYRIHVFSVGDVRRIFVQQKRRRTTGINPADNASESTIRNLDHGWIFANNDIVAPRTATVEAAVASIAHLNLQFGAVDLIEMDRPSDGGSVVLEVNCAPGLQGSTLDFYANAISDHLRGIVREVQPVATAEGVAEVDLDPEEQGGLDTIGGFTDPEAQEE